MTCSIIIPTIRRASILAITLDSLAIQTEGDFEVIVVCDGEDRETRALSEAYTAAYPLKWIFTPENHGMSSARNTGVAAAKGELLLFLDDDTAAAGDLVHQHRRHHLAREIGPALVVMGALVEVEIREPGSHTERFMRLDRAVAEAKNVACQTEPGLNSVELDHSCRIVGVNCSLTRDTFLLDGGFDPALRYRAEDFELASRLYDRGVQFTFERQAFVYHRESKDLAAEYRVNSVERARVDVLRAVKKGQHNAQTRGLTAARRQSPLQSLKLLLYWHVPKIFEKTGQLCRKTTDLTGSRVSFQLWRRVEMAPVYWQSVKAEGFSIESLRKLIGAPLPILRFGSISVSDRAGSGDRLPPQRFLRLMKQLRTLKYACVDPAKSLSGPTPERSVALIFHGGYEDFYYEVFPHINRFALKPIVFLVVDYIGGRSVWDEKSGRESRKLLSLDQIREMHRHGIRFGSQSMTNSWLPCLSDEDLHREVFESKARLEDIVGEEIAYFAYPYGGVDSRVRGAVARANYKAGVTSRGGLNFWEDELCLRSIQVNDCSSLWGLRRRLKTGWTPSVRNQDVRSIDGFPGKSGSLVHLPSDPDQHSANH